LLKEIKLDPPSKRNCLSCRGRQQAAQNLLNQMVGYEIAKLQGKL
jgi:hypothetical protein